ncbi:hypothetical protein, partial [Limosilactobacillus fermentum]|uniref:hypothetical protein n=1 Tax=Limosilactobacillus fermentum TaxID=1613 RepID=UPI003006C2D5
MVDGVNHGKLLSKLGVTTTKLNTRVSNKEIAEDRRFDLQLFLLALCQILLMGHFRRRPVLAPGAAFFQ